MKSKLSKTLGLNSDKKQNSGLKPVIKFEFLTNYYELFIHLETTELNYFKEILYQQQTDQIEFKQPTNCWTTRAGSIEVLLAESGDSLVLRFGIIKRRISY